MFFKILNFNKNIIFTFLLMYNFTKKLKMEFELIKTEVKNIIKTNENRDEKLSNICKLLQDSISYYNWVGFYFANHETKTLHLGVKFWFHDWQNKNQPNCNMK